MRFHNEGDKSRAICHRCKTVVTTTFARRDVPFSDGEGLARGILVGVCDQCDAVVSVPAQSTPAIRRARKEVLASLEANLPAVYLDLLDYAAHTINHEATAEFRRTLLSYFVHRAARDRSAVARLKKSHRFARERFPEPRGITRRRLSMKITAGVSGDLRDLQDRTQLNATELIKSFVVEIHDQVIARQEPQVLSELRTISELLL